MFKQIQNYATRTRNWGVALAGALTLTATSCEKEKVEPKPHVTTYTFSALHHDYLEDLAQIRASADSALVTGIEFKVIDANDKIEWEGVNLQNLINNLLVPAFDAANGKGTGGGVFNRVTDATKQPAIDWLTARNYKIKSM